MSLSRRVFLGLAGAAALHKPLLAQGGRAYTLEPDAAGRTLRDPQGRIVLTYLTSKPEGSLLAGNSACCIHPFNTLGGQRATDLAPADHRTHRGIFFAWHNMEFQRAGAEPVRADFWGWGAQAPVDGRAIVNRELRLVRGTAALGEIEVVNDWTVAGQTLMNERTSIVASERDGVRVLDVTIRAASDADMLLNRMAFTGFCFRARKEGPYTFYDSNGEVTLPNSSANNMDLNWPARPWYSHTVTLPDGPVISSAVIDHSSNPPSTWHGARSVSFLNPCIAAPAAFKIPARQPLTLRYLAIAHDGKFPDGLLDKMAAGWRRT